MFDKILLSLISQAEKLGFSLSQILFHSCVPPKCLHCKLMQITYPKVTTLACSSCNYLLETGVEFSFRAGRNYDSEELKHKLEQAYNEGKNQTSTTICDFCYEEKEYRLDESYGQKKICKKCQGEPEEAPKEKHEPILGVELYCRDTQFKTTPEPSDDFLW